MVLLSLIFVQMAGSVSGSGRNKFTAEMMSFSKARVLILRVLEIYPDIYSTVVVLVCH